MIRKQKMNEMKKGGLEKSATESTNERKENNDSRINSNKKTKKNRYNEGIVRGKNIEGQIGFYSKT